MPEASKIENTFDIQHIESTFCHVQDHVDIIQPNILQISKCFGKHR